MNWNDFVAEELKKPYFIKLVEFLKAEDQVKTILPPKDKRLSCFKLTPFDEVKVVIIGQDPYHDFHQAHGLAFSVESGSFPPSLRNIFKELVDDLGVPFPKTGDLTKWAKQGVLLLNTVLTVEVHEPLSHKDKGWEIFTLEAVKRLSDQNKPMIFILWGAHAQKFKMYISNYKHLVLTSVHPSPLSASRGFFGSKPFSKTNQYLIQNKLEPIDWSL
ncbi:MAG TPA: uracil-DNA glycosylase [Acholeplasmataceae bacterium]|nr:MAG: uracil-DNA glycosylase [Tenericutes bacterium GWD2_38_27]OHE40246.1 MAG: uracil-DNA glycosylase [Tenericutes bacterium GWE2_38_8]HBY65119.1 uracil-DNA glycosylase [Acholeplasmataceae bacterium]HCB66912.1 uracil-DNA glycosylase [Acholeplasmataceae bacterium]